jgi:hypothetical protein
VPTEVEGFDIFASAWTVAKTRTASWMGSAPGILCLAAASLLPGGVVGWLVAHHTHRVISGGRTRAVHWTTTVQVLVPIAAAVLGLVVLWAIVNAIMLA